MRHVPRSWTLAMLFLAGTGSPGVSEDAKHTIENSVLRISISPQDASLAVLDRRSGVEWRQETQPGFEIDPASIHATDRRFSANVVGRNHSLSLSVSLSEDAPNAFDLAIDISGGKYTAYPGYPFPFVPPKSAGWYYVQNTSGEGLLMPFDHREQIHKLFTWSSGQPWWGLTDLKRGMAARLDTFRNPDTRNNQLDRTVYALPLRINFSFYDDGGYVRLAKEYRRHLLHANPDMQPLAARVAERPAVAQLKDGVYCYFWGADPADDLTLVTEMKQSGIDHGLAVFYGRHEIDRRLCEGIQELGWTPGLYRMATGNLFHVSKNQGWPNALLTGKLDPDKFLAISNRSAWDRVCAPHLLIEWNAKAREAIRDYGIGLFYFDTLVVQLAPCLAPDHPATIEENLEARKQILRNTRNMGMLVGSGEGLAPTWALPELDFFEGAMSLRNYADIPLSVPSGDYDVDFSSEQYAEQAAIVLDETRRIPLYQLGFHDYVGCTWVWRDTNFQCTPFAWKKDLFNILYGTIPMWHIDRGLWEKHKHEMVASYHKINSVRGKIGFAEMTGHGWLTEDRRVQYSDWSTGDRVIVNFGDEPFSRKALEPVAARSFVIERVVTK